MYYGTAPLLPSKIPPPKNCNPVPVSVLKMFKPPLVLECFTPPPVLMFLNPPSIGDKISKCEYNAETSYPTELSANEETNEIRRK